MKLEVMASYTARLRAALLAEREARVQAEVQLVRAEVAAAEDAVARERMMSEELGALRGQASRYVLTAEESLSLECVSMGKVCFYGHESFQSTSSIRIKCNRDKMRDEVDH